MLHETNPYRERGNAPEVLPAEALSLKPNLKAEGIVSVYTAMEAFALSVSAMQVTCYTELKTV